MTKYFRTRWMSQEGTALRDEVLRRLLRGKSLDGLSLQSHDGRLDLRGFVVPQPRSAGAWRFKDYTVVQREGTTELRGVRLHSLDLSASDLRSLNFFDSHLFDCKFDGSDLRGWSLWGTTIESCSFRKAKLRGAVLGSWYRGRGNVYTRVDFSEADFRILESRAATYTDCIFDDSRIEKVDFGDSSFIRCRFSGTLQHVIFWYRAFDTGKDVPNPMESVDFSSAVLRWTEFRGLNLETVALPNTADHIVFASYRCALENARIVIRDRQDEDSNVFDALLEHYLKWAGPQQQRGVIHRLDLIESLGEEYGEYALQVLVKCDRRCLASP
jgi:uncharacterized protein YjbI with pentapeptide repeats